MSMGTLTSDPLVKVPISGVSLLLVPQQKMVLPPSLED